MSLFQDQEKRIRVLIALPLDVAYDYLCPPGMEVQVGDFVRVPLANRERIGVVWALNPGLDPDDKPVAFEKLKPVLEKIDQPALPRISVDFVEWVARYTLQMRGLVLKMVMGPPDVLKDPKPQTLYQISTDQAADLRLTPARTKVLACLEEEGALALSQLCEKAEVTASVVKTLHAKGALVTRSHPGDQTARPSYDPAKAHQVTLEPDQAEAAQVLVNQTRKSGEDDGFKCFLLDGVPGAGKTEVYFEAVEQALKNRQQVLVMLPEIALSAQWFGRFEKRFGFRPHVWHSDIGSSLRRKTWRAVVRGQASVVVGARSALFLPFQNLGLIVVDEEHDSSFKQEDGVIYNGRDMAVVRARLSGCPVILASATPSLETMVNAWDKRYERLKLSARHGGAVLPDLQTIDMRAHPPERQHWISPVLVQAINETLERGEQVLLYLNRRGYAPLTLCRRCGHRLECPHCTSWLVEHRALGNVQCHHCGYSRPMPKSCPTCDTEDSFAACGPGVERVFEEVQLRFPNARAVIASSDSLQTPDQAARLIKDLEDHNYDVVIGTQMVTKGYHFPLLTLVGVIDADLGLDGGELRACERTYQLLYQVAGRAGRADLRGQVYLQTYVPDHPVMQAMQNGQRDPFLKAESESRQTAAMPPYGRLCAIIVSGEDEEMVLSVSEELRQKAPAGEDLVCLGPSRAPLYMIRGRYRMRLLLKAGKTAPLQKIMRHWLGQMRIPGKIRLQVDIDPYSFL